MKYSFCLAAALANLSVMPLLALAANGEDRLNDINDMCAYNFESGDGVVPAYICAQKGLPADFTTGASQSLVNSAGFMCCKSSSEICVISEKSPVAGCWNENTYLVRIYTDRLDDGNSCKDPKFTGNSCSAANGVNFTTKGTQIYSSVKDGKGVIYGEEVPSSGSGGSSSSGSGTGAGSSGKTSAGTLNLHNLPGSFAVAALVGFAAAMSL
ncbi:hypothetical protein B0T25DRAFT_628958 [Lasiosphaeria hispida]|uniref:Uncharacterized protein n=1 Tax=Lasiosphaeria hispida TaxID=260671 RepID=A0AAJ0HQH9_9PEZI|nr:hypothetical protein B0T25DRAFT_628958 [Lasiosphaeria hispida]